MAWLSLLCTFLNLIYIIIINIIVIIIITISSSNNKNLLTIVKHLMYFDVHLV